MNHLQIIQRINQISIAANDIDELLASVLEEILSIFECDRAWLLYPCDPVAPTWRVPMERARPEWPGAHAEGCAIATDSETAELFKQAIESKKAITYDVASARGVPKSVAEHFSVRAQMVLAVYPKSSKPWLLGIHHCAKAHVFSKEEQQVFGEISQSITASLSNLIAMQALRDSEQYNRMLFEQSPIGLALCRMNGELVDINPAYAAILGRTVEETLSLTYWEITPEKYAENEVRQLESLEHNGKYGPYEKEYIHKNGHLVPVRLSGMIFKKEGEKFIWSSVEDNTEQKQAEVALLESQKMLRLVLDSIPARVFWKDNESRYLGCNRLFAMDAGLESSEQIIGKLDFDLAWKEQAEIYRDDDHEVIQSGQAKLNYEEPQTSPDGTSLWLKTSKIPLTDLSQTVIGVLGTYEDITERKKQEEALRESEESFRMLVDQSPVGIGISTQGKIRYVNSAYLRMFGYDAETDLAGYSLLDTIAPECREEIAERVARRFHGEAVSNRHETIGLKLDGSKFPFEVDVHLMDLPDGQASVAFLSDLTERKQAEEALHKAHDELEMRVQERTTELAAANEFLKKEIAEHEATTHALIESEQKFHIIFESSNDAIMLLSENEFIDCNDATLRMFACTKQDELLGKHPAEISPPRQPDGTDSRQLADERIASALRTGRNFFEWMHRRVGGEDFPAEVLLTPMTLEGRPVLQATVRDITERKQAEEKTLELLQQNRGLTQRLFQIQEQERRHLARELHDEFGQWLTVIRLNAHLLDERCSDTELDIRDSINTINDISSQMHQGIRRMIHQLRPAELDQLGLKDSLKELVDQWQAHYPQTRCVLSMRGSLDDINDTVTVTIYRIVQESLTNMAKYAKADNVSILLRRNAALKDGPDYLLLTIEDDGKGIDLNKPTNGVGLAGMRERVLAAGGEFMLKSSPGAGVHIEAQLPVTTL